MTSDGTQPLLHVAARDIPVPAHLSAEAQAVLGMGRMGGPPYPEPDDIDGWRTMIAAQDAMVVLMTAEQTSRVTAQVNDVEVDGVPVYVITPQSANEDDPRVYLEIHGGGLIAGGGDACRAMGRMAAARNGICTWAVDYRMPPDHPYPTPLDDCLTVYRAILRNHRPQEVIVAGSSAGANLAAALILRARDEGLPLPAAAVLLTPELDLTESGDSFATNLGVDTILTTSLMPANLLYAAGHDLAHPYLSPLFGDFTKGFPPTLLASGTRDMFLSNTVRMHRSLRAANIQSDLHILEAAPHGGFLSSAPEDAALGQEVHRFVDSVTAPKEG